MTADGTQPPFAVECRRHLWIPMPDGVRLAARLWLPRGGGPVPTILEYIPYRKSDGMSARDHRVHPWFAARGYAALRVDLRGSGDSEGVLLDEYAAQEQADALAILEWIAAQPWSDGSVGMMGISWGGFNALQAAALRPPQLKAIVTVGSTDDRYADDVHYMGGCQLSANLTWSQTFFADLTRPPDPEAVGEAWRDLWLQRLEAARPLIAEWAAHPLRDGYWRHGSVCEDYGAIEVPVLAVGGWADSYTNSVLRLMTGLSGPRRGLIGPWGHDYPHLAVPGPRIAFLGESLRWWDRWLKGRETGVEEEPLLRLWLQEDLPPEPTHESRAGHWIGLDAWPCADVRPRDLFLSHAGLVETEPAAFEIGHRSAEDNGMGAGEWCAYGAAADQPTDQQQDDGLSLCFDGPPLSEALDMVGTPEVRLELSVDRPRAQVAVRLCDVAPDGRSARVSYGLLNLNHREGHERFRPLVPGERIQVTLRLNDVAHRFRAGHRLRVAVSTAYWPTAWPAPDGATLTLHAGSRLIAPLWSAGAQSRALPPLPGPEETPPEPRRRLRDARFERRVEQDLADGTSRTRVLIDYGEELIEASGLRIGRLNDETYSIRRDDPLSARIDTRWVMTMARGDWSIRTESNASMTANADRFFLRADLSLYEDGRMVGAWSWDETIPREGNPTAGEPAGPTSKRE